MPIEIDESAAVHPAIFATGLGVHLTTGCNGLSCILVDFFKAVSAETKKI